MCPRLYALRRRLCGTLTELCGPRNHPHRVLTRVCEPRRVVHHSGRGLRALGFHLCATGFHFYATGFAFRSKCLLRNPCGNLLEQVEGSLNPLSGLRTAAHGPCSTTPSSSSPSQRRRSGIRSARPAAEPTADSGVIHLVYRSTNPRTGLPPPWRWLMPPRSSENETCCLSVWQPRESIRRATPQNVGRRPHGCACLPGVTRH